MLEVMRKSASSWVIKILFGFLILSFAAWGVGDFISKPSGGDAVVTAGSIKISRSEINNEFNREVGRFRQMFGPKFSAEEAKKMGLLDMIIERVAMRALLDLEVAELGLKVGTDELRRSIAATPAFQNEAGELDPQLFAQVLAANNLGEQEFLKILKRDLARNQLVSSLGEGTAVPAIAAETIYRYKGEKRVINYAKLPLTGEVAAASEEEIQKYYDNNKARYSLPEYRAVSFVLIGPESVISNIKIEKEKIEEAYEQRKEEYQTPERREINQKLYKNQEEALKGEGGEEINLGLLEKNNLLPEQAEAVFALKQGEKTAPLQSPMGWHVFTVTAIEPGKVRPLAEVKKEIELELKLEQSGKAIYEMGAKLEDTLGGGASLQEAAEKLGLDFQKIEAIDAKGNDIMGSKVENQPRAANFVSTAFATAPGGTSGLIETENGYFMLQVNGITPPASQPLDVVREDVVKNLQIQKKRDMASKQAEAILAKVKGGDAAGLEIKTSTPISRENAGEIEGVPAGLIAVMFKKALNEWDAISSEDGVVLAQVKEVEPADPKANPDAVDEILKQLTQSVSMDLMEEFQYALQNRYPVTVNRKLMGENN